MYTVGNSLEKHFDNVHGPLFLVSVYCLTMVLTVMMTMTITMTILVVMMTLKTHGTDDHDNDGDNDPHDTADDDNRSSLIKRLEGSRVWKGRTSYLRSQSSGKGKR